MYLLQMLGGLALTGANGAPIAGPASQRHRLALLALLALRGPAPTSRDKLLGLLWPERDAATARRLLNLAVHALRKALGAGAVRSVGDGLVLDPAVVASDVSQFDAAVSGAEGLRAAALYRGPFLDGFFLPDSPEFDRWADGVRAELAQRHAALLGSLAAAREAEGEWHRAAEWWQRLARLDPGSGRVVRRLMLALEATHDRAGALAQARAHAHFMRTEFGAEPDPEVTAVVRMLTRRGATPAPAPRRREEVRALAIVPFVTSGFGDTGGSFGEGLTIELRHRLTAAGLRLRGGLIQPGRSVLEIGLALGVAGVVQGSVRQSGDRVRVTASLVETTHGLHLWSGVAERKLGDWFTLQEELAGEIVLGVVGEWGLDGVSGGDLDARGLVLRGRYALGRRTVTSVRTAIRYFSAALSRAPRDPSAFSGLADAYAVMGFYSELPPAEAFGASRRAAREALRFDPRLAAPRAALAYADLYHRWNLPRADARFQRAMARDPLLALTHQWYANLLVAAGCHEDAIREMRRAVALDPQSLVAGAGVGWAMYYAGRHEEAVEQCGTTLELDPNFAPAHLWRGLALQELNRWDEAIHALESAQTLLHAGPRITAMLARALAAGGQRARGEALLAGVEAAPGYLPASEIAKVHLALGRRDTALDWLERAGRERDHGMVLLRVDPQLAPLRQEPRFLDLLRLVTT